MSPHPIVHVNASLNLLATVLLIVGFLLIKRRKEQAHKWAMLAAFGASIVFLGCYLYYHLVLNLQTPFGGDGLVKFLYLTILLSHIALAMNVPFLAVWTIYLGLRAHGDWLPTQVKLASEAEQSEYMQRMRILHRWWAKITFPVWMYVSVTGVVVYVMLYHLWPPEVF
ncbi:DUF420 domain-containing protein [Aeoliella mucimassa]|uniref:DUF420 domain-containing protein n=1 Tax=Aeoliella mucimassa TaxID=2527972 RepID=A0A518AK81_9BACT|nr:DUF420 domain-containing protein [Aeoliella mucimassa]QDU55142.1 hypothetical protein Pan181_13280 [Aeoliella mucimassa]